MKTFLLFLLTIVVVTAAPHTTASEETVESFQLTILKEIVDSVNILKNKQTTQTFVAEVITTRHCTMENFCKSGSVLQSYAAAELRLNEAEWLLPRQLIAYTRNITCESSASADKIELQHLLQNIQICAQKVYSNSAQGHAHMYSS